MTDSDEREEAPSDRAAGLPIDAERAARLVAKAEAKAVKAVQRAARTEAKAVARAAKVADKAAKAADKAARRAADAAAKADARAVRAVQTVERKAAKAEAKAQKSLRREARALARAANDAGGARAAGGAPQSPAVAAASAALKEAAALLWQGAGPADEAVEVPAAEQPEAQDAEDAEAAFEEGLEFETSTESAVAVKPEPEPEPTVEAGATPEGEADAAEEPEPEPEASLEPEEAALEPEASLEPEVSFEPEEAAEPVPSSQAEAPREAVPAPEAGVALEPEEPPEPGVEPEVEPGAEPEAEPETPTADELARGAMPEVMPPTEAGAFELTAGDTPAALLAPATGGPRVQVPAGALVAAAIDVGSTSVHLLVGTVDGHRVAPLLDESVFLGLGERVNAQGYFGEETRAALLGDLERYAAAARELGAVSITVVGTDPLRRAEDAPSVVHAVATRIGVPLHVLDHAEEGLLTLIGATGGMQLGGELLLVDIGGGSSEFVTVRPDGTVRGVGIPLGATRLTQGFVRSDPPTLAEIEGLRAETARQVAAAPAASPVEIVAVGGTASNLLRLLPTTGIDRALTRRRIAVALAMLSVERSGEAASRHLIRPERARILPAGAIIVDAILEKYGVDRLRVSEEGIREGAILAATHGGPAWRDRLAALASGWVESVR